jgi:hypothetical protein
MPETPFGRVVQVRMEKDSKIIQKMSKHEKKIRNDWAVFKAQHMPKNIQTASIEQLQGLLKGLAGFKEKPKGGG